MNNAGLRFWKKGDKISFPNTNIDVKLKNSGKANYFPKFRVVGIDGRSSTDDIRHELAHAWDHLQLFKRRQLKRLDDLKASKLENVLASTKGPKLQSETSRVIKKAFKEYKKRLGGEKGRASGEMECLFCFENDGTEEGYSLKSLKEFYTEGYSVFHGENSTAQARLLFSAPELYKYLEKEAKRFKLNIPNRNVLKKIKIL